MTHAAVQESSVAVTAPHSLQPAPVPTLSATEAAQLCAGMAAAVQHMQQQAAGNPPADASRDMCRSQVQKLLDVLVMHAAAECAQVGNTAFSLLTSVLQHDIVSYQEVACQSSDALLDLMQCICSTRSAPAAATAAPHTTLDEQLGAGATVEASPAAVQALQLLTLLTVQLLPRHCLAAAGAVSLAAGGTSDTQTARPRPQQETAGQLSSELRLWVRSVTAAYLAAERAALPPDSPVLQGMRRAAAAVVISLQAVSAAAGCDQRVHE